MRMSIAQKNFKKLVQLCDKNSASREIIVFLIHKRSMEKIVLGHGDSLQKNMKKYYKLKSLISEASQGNAIVMLKQATGLSLVSDDESSFLEKKVYNVKAISVKRNIFKKVSKEKVKELYTNIFYEVTGIAFSSF